MTASVDVDRRARRVPRRAATLTVAAEFRRQAARRRTQLTLGFMVALPLIILVGVPVRWRRRRGRRRPADGSPAWSDLATTGGPNFTLFTLLVSAASCWSWWWRCSAATPWPARRAGEPALPAGAAGPAGPPAGGQAGWSRSATARWRCSSSPARRCSAGTLRYGWAPLRSHGRRPSCRRPKGWSGCWRVVGYLAVTLLVVAALAFLLSVLTDAPLGAVGGAVLL